VQLDPAVTFPNAVHIVSALAGLDTQIKATIGKNKKATLLIRRPREKIEFFIILLTPPSSEAKK
jgi:hypothetical protein